MYPCNIQIKIYKNCLLFFGLRKLFFLMQIKYIMFATYLLFKCFLCFVQANTFEHFTMVV